MVYLDFDITRRHLLLAFILCGILCNGNMTALFFQLKNHQCQFNCNEDRLVSEKCNLIKEAANFNDQKKR